MNQKEVYENISKQIKNKASSTILVNFCTPGREYVRICDIYNQLVNSGFIQLIEHGETIWQRNLNDENLEKDAAYVAIKLSKSLCLFANLGNTPVHISNDAQMADGTLLILYAECNDVNLLITASCLTCDNTNGISYFIGVNNDNSFDSVKQASFNILAMYKPRPDLQYDTADESSPQKEGWMV